MYPSNETEHKFSKVLKDSSPREFLNHFLRFLLGNYFSKSPYVALLVKEMENQKQENYEELLKEALGRAKKEEKLKYEKISDRQVANAKRIIAILDEYEELCEKSERNKCPESTPAEDSKRVAAMSSAEFNEWIERTRKESHESFVWSSKTLSIMKDQIVLVKELMELGIELWRLETEEKWLLLSIALRSQPNLLKYL